MTDTSVVFNVIGRDTGVGNVLGRVKSLFKSTGAEGAAAMKVVDHEVEKLDHDIKSAKDSLQVLAREFAKAATASERLSISRRMSRESKDLGQLTKARNLLGDDTQVRNQGKQAGAKIEEGILDGISPLKMGAANPILIGMAVGSAPFIGAVIEGAIVGGAGIGGVVGGAIIVSKDTRVQAAWKELAASAKPQLQQAAAPFIPAMQDAIHIASREFDTLVPVAKRVFAASAQYVAPLTRGVMGFVSEFAHGFEKAVERAGPVIEVISNNLPRIGEEIGNLFETASEHAVAGAQALDVVFRIIEATVGSVTKLVGWLARAYEIEQLTLGNFGPLVSSITGAGAASDTAATSAIKFNEATDATATAAADAAQRVHDLTTAMDDFADSNLSLYDAQTNAQQAIAESTKALKENGKTLDINKPKGQANRDMLTNLAKSFNSVTTANDKANTSAKQSNADYDRQRAAFVKAATGAGMASGAANRLADSVLKIPKNKIVNISANTKAAQAGINAVDAALGRIPRVVAIAMRITGTKSVSAAAAAIRKNEARAGGGPVQRDTPYLVGEEGPELVVPQTDGTVLTASMTRGVMGQSQVAPRPVGGGGTRAAIGGGGTRVARIEVTGPRAVAELVRYLVRTVDVVNTAAG